jgi:hypothetical protein
MGGTPGDLRHCRGSSVSLRPGPHSLTATFIRANLSAFRLSTSTVVAFVL